jgi:homoserine dehydrogenase
VLRTTDWREVVSHPEIDMVAELIGGTHVAREVLEAAIDNGKSVVTANKELMAACGAEIWDRAIRAGVNLGIEASVAGGIPILATLREGIAGDRVTSLFGILNGTCNYILTEIERHGTPFDVVLREAQKLGYAEANPADDVDGFDARSKLAILAALAFGEKITPSDIYTEGIRRVLPVDFQYAHQLDYTIRLICAARQTAEGLILSVRPSLISNGTILAGVRGSYNAIWIRGHYGQDTFYYGRGAGPLPTGVAVVSDMMRVAREIRSGSPERVSPFAHERLGEYQPISIERLASPYFLRFRVEDRPGIIARLATVLSDQGISLDAVLQIPSENWRDLPFVITTQPCREESLRAALADMAEQDFLIEPPFAMPMERSLQD